jgi:DNA mismatch repair ATPase MutS
MMAQYLEIKRVHPDGLLSHRMGDFYEVFDRRCAMRCQDVRDRFVREFVAPARGR